MTCGFSSAEILAFKYFPTMCLPHRSQYGFGAKTRETKDGIEIGYGFAKYLRDALPNASFIGFTCTPVEHSNRNTRAVFGEHININDLRCKAS